MLSLSLNSHKNLPILTKPYNIHEKMTFIYLWVWLYFICLSLCALSNDYQLTVFSYFSFFCLLHVSLSLLCAAVSHSDFPVVFCFALCLICM